MKNASTSNYLAVVGVVAMWLSSPSSSIWCTFCHGFVPSIHSTVRSSCEWAGGNRYRSIARGRTRGFMSSIISGSGPTKTKTKGKPKPKTAKRRQVKSIHTTVEQMLQHDILTKDEEQMLAKTLQRAMVVKEAMGLLLQEKQHTQYDAQKQLEEDEDSVFYANHPDTIHLNGEEDYDSSNPLYIEEEQSVLPNKPEEVEPDHAIEMDSSIGQLTDDEIVYNLQVPGGREELRTILLQGNQARQQLVRRNIRLVVSIAKKFSQQSVNVNDGTAKGGGNKNLVNVYSGDWTRPSIEEAIQEGILGLSRAADKFDPSQGYRFSTYATYWITNFVRRCFHRSTTGSFRVPPYFYDVRHKYKVSMRKYSEEHGEQPSLDVIAADCGVTTTRLLNILRLTRPLLSIDAPIIPGGPQAAGKAGAADTNDSNLLLSFTLPCGEPLPEEQVERSLLRQCLENAMATELSPNERDVLRLRLGLDDGVTRTIREVVDLCGGSLSMTEVRSAEQRAFRKLRSPYAVHTYELMGYLHFAGIDDYANNDNSIRTTGMNSILR